MKCDEPGSRYDLPGEQGKVSSRGRRDPAEAARGKWGVGGDCVLERSLHLSLWWVIAPAYSIPIHLSTRRRCNRHCALKGQM